MLHNKISDIDFVIFDVETTGLLPRSGDRIIEIAAMRFRSGKPYDSFSSLLNPEREISPAAFAVNHISQEMVESAPLACEVIPRFLEFAGKGCLAGYNVGFDIGFLENEMQLFGESLAEDTAVVDIIRMARSILPRIDSYGLASVSRYLGIRSPQQHRALSDVEMTAQVFAHLVGKLKDKGLDDFLHFYNLFGTNLKLIEGLSAQRINAIQRAIDLGVELNIRYYSGSAQEVTERKVSPKEIRQEGKSKYLVGYCHLRKDERTFKINAILDLEVV
ncbi:MAG: hypothetical protein A2Y00_04600 [Omnitrophica WOR_2 bacterium GWF2_43_52]|nr:MAG: hypothetical protein A2Y00_04600 [Omnitrophica WOR_2 bacterium GWF2_43_52]OGX56663.1 MAG: hypothetical protein A2460_00905 [Omnitrophica WOR_2 bacterium RIFOXYC2_FULL_43_9]HAH20660.1 hypothetical protein [Candidatus Omnitrophota bacterium]HBG63011.1 hypothetical protein [Candidatus Omnitrophota bacterium]HCD37398.1 hypothetical protein [Candidatus Omnitrophota bacterium]